MQLGQLGFAVPDQEIWTAFFTEVLGLTSAGGGRFRMDDHAWRFQLSEGPGDLDYVSWECVDDAEFQAVAARLETAGVPAIEADPGVRDVARRLTFLDPAGIPTEVTVGNARAAEPFDGTVVRGGFIAGDLGLGHLVLSTKDKAESVQFYATVLGAKLSDHIVTTFFGHDVDLSFFHVNPRHHSVAFGGPQRHRLNHFMVEVHTVDEVGLAFDRTLRAGLRINQTIGRHPNDGMISFYARTPSGFQFEVGCNGRKVDDTTWQTTTYDHISTWGHHPPMVMAPKPKR